ncbi:MAG TPA: cation-translocating P-type ATPase, partial [Ktedonobacteraceae bacterium]|nr:cation-translocating P-type ATPase [Ktedonobacteraceae bacterium]
MAKHTTIEVPVQGMDCTECTMHVRKAIAALPGVEAVDVLLSTEKAIVQLDPAQVDLPAIRKAVANAGYSVPEQTGQQPLSSLSPFNDFTRRILTLFGIVFGVVLFVVVVGEWLGFFEAITEHVPWWIGLGIVLIGGYPVFLNVMRATLKGRVISHTLMSIGVLAALVIGQWATAAVVVFFMRVGDFAERFTTERARRAVKDLSALAPQTARVVRDEAEVDVPVSEVHVGELVVVRPGEQIPVDGVVVSGQATVDQSTITGESMPIEIAPGGMVFAASFTRLGSLRIRVSRVGEDTTFGHVIKLVEQAEAQRAPVQRIADKFSAYYLPVVALIALLTFVLRHDPLASAAVLVVACSCSFTLATPIAMLASIGAGAKRGLLIKGGKYLEILARADVLLIDKTGTLTLGRPRITAIQAFNELSEDELLALAATVERDSEHPIAEAVRQEASRHKIALYTAQDFCAMPGVGVQARVNDHVIMVGSQKIFAAETNYSDVQALEAQGQTLLCVARDGMPL